VLPADLDHTDLGVGEAAGDPAQKIRLGHEVGVEDEDQLAGRGGQPGLERAGLEAGAVTPVVVLDVAAELDEPRAFGAAKVGGVVGRIVQDLDLQPVAGPVARCKAAAER
jgi:hypothetical protein